tara:strand:- start:999 stop:1478 length:480 start_codon:yes stop_codon:yes gene_type:complete
LEDVHLKVLLQLSAHRKSKIVASDEDYEIGEIAFGDIEREDFYKKAYEGGHQAGPRDEDTRFNNASEADVDINPGLRPFASAEGATAPVLNVTMTHLEATQNAWYLRYRFITQRYGKSNCQWFLYEMIRNTSLSLIHTVLDSGIRLSLVLFSLRRGQGA